MLRYFRLPDSGILWSLFIFMFFIISPEAPAADRTVLAENFTSVN